MNFQNHFPPTSTEQWEAAIEKLLKGKDYNDTLIWNTDEGFDVKPYYRKEDLPKQSYPLFHKKDNNWFIREEIVVNDEKTANQKALNALMKGANAVSFICSNSPDLDLLLNNIETEFAPVSIYVPQTDNQLVRDFKAINKNKMGGVFVDVFGGLLKGTDTITPEDKIASLSEFIQTGGRLLFDGTAYRNAGSNITQELTFTLASIIELVEKSGLGIAELCNASEVSFGLASNYFFEIAKLKAFTYLLEKAAEAYGVELNSHPTYSAKSSQVNRTIYDSYVNMLRGTTEAMSAGIAGYDNITILPFDSVYAESDEFSGRIARNIQLILQEESFFTQVIDPANGSYYVEHLVDEFINHSWKSFLAIEEKGGYLKGLETGLIQSEIKKHADTIIQKVENVEQTVLGVNKHPNPDDKMSEKVSLNESNDVNTELTKTYQPLIQARWVSQLETNRLKEENN